MDIRLDKFVSTALGCTRSEAKKLITKGTITIDGVSVRKTDAKIEEDSQQVCFNQKPLSYKKNVYILMNKPLGVVSATEDRDCQTVLDILPDNLLRKGLFPAGRLDKYSCGMMIITDDGEFAHKILSPKNHVPKVYQVKTDAPVMTKEMAEKFAKGVYLGGGEYSSPAKLEIIDEFNGMVTIHEGIYHQVRRMFDQNGGKVIFLKRVQMGNLKLDETLAEGESRYLTKSELQLLEKSNSQID